MLEVSDVKKLGPKEWRRGIWMQGRIQEGDWGDRSP